jgi:hypothetical protein
LIALAWLGLACASPSASAAAEVVSASIQENGSGLMIANSSTNPEDETWSWEACSRDLSSCEAFAQGRIVTTSGAPPRTVFRATSNYGVTGTSPVWRGRVKSVRSPSVRGPVRANELVTPVPGRWKGGWAGSDDWLQLAACKGPHGRSCTTLTDMHFGDGCENEAAVLDPQFTGQYLRVADWRVGPNSGMLDYGVGSPYRGTVWKKRRAISVAMVGRIAAANSPRTDDCGAPPLDAGLDQSAGRPGGR